MTVLDIDDLWVLNVNDDRHGHRTFMWPGLEMKIAFSSCKFDTKLSSS